MQESNSYLSGDVNMLRCRNQAAAYLEMSVCWNDGIKQLLIRRRGVGELYYLEKGCKRTRSSH